jgi:hypothetical protein
MQEQQTISRPASGLAKLAMLVVPPIAVMIAIYSSKKPVHALVAALALRAG